MDRPSKIFLSGIICAAVISAIGFANIYRLESNLKKLEAACIKEVEAHHNEPALDLKPVCNAWDLINLDSSSSPLVGIQADIIAAQREAWKFQGWPYLLAGGILVLSGIPWAWYFLLRRIRELRDAIAGK